MVRLTDVLLFIVGAAVVLFAAKLGYRAAPSVGPSREVQQYLAKHGLTLPLRGDLGDAHWVVLASSALAQRYFDQGLRWVVAYDFKQALANFVQAQVADPTCAMCAWGEALARGQNLNEFLNVEPDNVRRAFAAVERARRINTEFRPRTPAEHATRTLEAQLVAALALRQLQHMPAHIADRAASNAEYADAMEALASTHPDNEWVLFFAADAAMNTSPWDYWLRDPARLKPRLERAVQHLDAILRVRPHHAGALHMMIHIFEAAPDPTRAVEASKSLEGLVPGSEHLLHMPSHGMAAGVGCTRSHSPAPGYIRGGLFARAAFVNHEAVRLVHLSEHVYPEHNIEFIAFCERSIGDAPASQASAVQLEQVSESLLATGRDGYEAIFPYERFVVAPLHNAVVFGLWEWLANVREPPHRRVYHRGVYHWAQAHRLLATNGAEADVQAHTKALHAATQEMHLASNVMRYSADLFPARQLMAILQLLLHARTTKQQQQQQQRGMEHLVPLREAVAIEDAFFYDEPPSQFFGTRIVLGYNLLEVFEVAEARRVFEGMLVQHPGNPWALNGLARACRELADAVCESDARAGFAKAWRGGDKSEPVQYIV